MVVYRVEYVSSFDGKADSAYFFRFDDAEKYSTQVIDAKITAVVVHTEIWAPA